MSESPPPKKSGSIWLLACFVATVAIVGYVGWRWANVPTGHVAQVQILVTKRGGEVQRIDGDPRKGIVDDYLSTHMVLLRSQTIIDHAVDKKNLKALKSFENTTDVVAEIGKMLRVTRNRNDDSTNNHVLLIECRGPVGDDCAKIVNAVIESYKEFLDLTYKNVNGNTVALINKARDTLKAELVEAQERYHKFRIDNPQIVSKGMPSGNDIESLAKKRIDARVRQAEIAAQIARAEEKPDSLQTKIKAREWATAAGYDSLPEDVRKSTTMTAAYLDYLRGELETSRRVEAAVSTLMEERLNQMRMLVGLELEEVRLRGDVEQIKLLFDATVKRLTEINLVRDSGGFDVRVLAPPQEER